MPEGTRSPRMPEFILPMLHNGKDVTLIIIS